LYAAEQTIIEQTLSISEVTGAAACDNGGETAVAVQPLDKQTLSHNGWSDHAKHASARMQAERHQTKAEPAATVICMATCRLPERRLNHGSASNFMSNTYALRALHHTRTD